MSRLATDSKLTIVDDKSYDSHTMQVVAKRLLQFNYIFPALSFDIIWSWFSLK